MALAPTAPVATPAPTGSGSLSVADQARFDSILKAHDYTPPSAPGTPEPAQNWRTLAKGATSAPAMPVAKIDPKTGLPDGGTGDSLPGKAISAVADAAKQSVQGAVSSVKEGADVLSNPAPMPKGFLPALGSELKKGVDLTNAGLDTGFAGLGFLFSPVTAAIKSLSATASNNPEVQKFAMTIGPALDKLQAGKTTLEQLAIEHPSTAHSITNLFNLLTLGGGEKGIDAAGDAAGKAKDAIGEAFTPPEGGPPGEEAPIAPADGAGIIEKAQLAATKGNQIPTLENAAQKGIPLPGEQRIRDEKGTPITAETSIKSPLERYDEHVATQQTALRDAKSDTALGQVGSKIGDAFEQVAKQRRDAGETMQSELEKIGEKPTNTSDAISKFHGELSKNGIEIDPEAGLIRSNTSKITESDKSLLSEYHKELESLGTNPTVAHLDAFLSRIPDEIKVYKAKNNIIGSTNGERIIKSNLRELRSQFKPGEGTGYLKDYAAARAKYADLSKFLEEGVGYLGKKTQSGDYAKDASIAKSSVQSMLNNGKKDWLISLEKHSGYPAIDDATLALQAMKDTGDYRGASLLEAITHGAAKGELPQIPTSGTGIINAALGGLLKKGTQKFTGTPVEQTRRFLKSLKK